MKKQITSISLVQTAKVAAVMYFVLGLIGVVFTLLMSLIAPATQTTGLLFALLAPFLWAFFGFIFVFVACWIYNQIAKRVGGIEFTTSEVRGDF